MIHLSLVDNDNSHVCKYRFQSHKNKTTSVFTPLFTAMLKLDSSFYPFGRGRKLHTPLSDTTIRKSKKKRQVLGLTLLSTSVHLRVRRRPAAGAFDSRRQLRLGGVQAVVAQRRAMASRSNSASSRTSSRSEYRLGVLLWPNSLSSLEALGRRAAFSFASSTCRTTSWTSWILPWAERDGCGRASAEGRGLLLITSSLMPSEWNGVDLTEMRTCGEKPDVKPEPRRVAIGGHGVT